MGQVVRFELGFAPEVIEHLAAIERTHHPLIQAELDEQLTYAPDQETRTRKPVEQPAPFGATWELRIGPGNHFRVFYEVDPIERVVWILALGVKKRERLFVGGEEFGL